MATSPGEHWEQVYRTRTGEAVSWFQADPATSVRLVTSFLEPAGSVVDVGAGSSHLVDVLVARGVRDLTLLDVSQHALEVVRKRLGPKAGGVAFVASDLLAWQPGRSFDLWHDRAVFHFLTSPPSRAAYVRLVEQAVVPGGTVVLATFATDGPTQCSGLQVCRYDAADLAGEFGPTFQLLHSEREEHTTPAGVVQPFTWVVLRRA